MLVPHQCLIIAKLRLEKWKRNEIIGENYVEIFLAMFERNYSEFSWLKKLQKEVINKRRFRLKKVVFVCYDSKTISHIFTMKNITNWLSIFFHFLHVQERTKEIIVMNFQINKCVLLCLEIYHFSNWHKIK